MSTLTVTTIIGKPEIVTLVLKTTSPKVRRPMYCIHCAKLLLFTYRKVVSIIEGAADVNAISEEIQCKTCKALYEIC